MYSGNKGFLMTDGLISILIVSIMVLIVLGTMKVHTGIYDSLCEQTEICEDTVRNGFSETERCEEACEIEEEPSS
ncbi:MAG: hypothetical protein IKR11_07730 [Solobacterium sp.]|nr:hypothetical protein [Solobacterium sp.]